MLVRLGLSTTGVLTVATLLAACNNMSSETNYKVTSEAIADYQSKNTPISSYWMPEKFLKWSAKKIKIYFIINQEFLWQNVLLQRI